MAYRLSVTGGAAVTPADSTSVVTFVDRIDDRGLRFRELLTEETYATFQLARDRAAAHGRQALVVGLDPWQTAFPLDALQSLVQAYEARTEGPRATEAPWVRVFSVRP